jgi:hypothetical protein
MQLRLHKDGYILGSEYISDLVEGEHKEDKEHTSDVQKPNEVPGHGHHDEHGGQEGAVMNIHKHSSVQDPLKVIKDVKRALQDQEGCRVDLLNLFLFCELFYLLQISFFFSQTIVSYWLCILVAKCPMNLRFACG